MLMFGNGGGAWRLPPAAPGRAWRWTVRFFAAMLALTLIARGTASALLPAVAVTTPGSGTVRQSVTVSGVIAPAESVRVSLPAELEIERVDVQPGQTVAQGQTLAAVSGQSLTRALALAKAQLAQAQAEADTLASQAVTDTTGLQSAQQSLAWAYQDDAAAYDALQALKAEQAQRRAERDAASHEGESEEERQKRLEQEAQEDETMRQELEAAQTAAETAHRAAQQAEYARDSARTAQQETERQAALNAETNAAAAQETMLTLAECRDTVDALQAIADADGAVTAPMAGTVGAVYAVPGESCSEALCTLYDPVDGYTFTASAESDMASGLTAGLSAAVRQGAARADAAVASAVPDTETGQVSLTVRLDTAAAWTPGTAEAEVVISETQYGTCLPAAAVQEDAQGKFVYLVEEKNTVLGRQNVLTRLPVQVQETNGSTAAVIAALAADSRVALPAAGQTLTAGERVKISEGA